MSVGRQAHSRGILDMSYVRSFLPWIVFAILPSAQWQWAAPAAFVLSVLLIARERRAGAGLDALTIELGSAVFFAVLAVIAFENPGSGVHDYAATLSSAALGTVAGVSLLIGKPFTLGIAKRSTPREVWELKPFVRTNVVITAVWTAAFVVTAVALGLLAHAGQAHSTPATVVQLAGFAVPMVFTVRYVAFVLARARA
jgi:hypothetical protein